MIFVPVLPTAPEAPGTRFDCTICVHPDRRRQWKDQQARAMLSKAESNLAHVAFACGFSSQSHLTTAFRHSLGVTLRVYRQSVAGMKEIAGSSACLNER
jgi:AraC-like DNA-binding protein